MTNKNETIINLYNQDFKLIELYGIDEQGNCTCRYGAKCNCAGKHPVKSSWQENYIKSLAELKYILNNHKNPNFGIVTGNGLVVIDIDKRHGGFESLEKIEHSLNELDEPIMIVKTGGDGLHLYYKTDEVVRNRTNLLPGVDVRGDGGYVVAPASKHKSGNYYEIEKGEINA